MTETLKISIVHDLAWTLRKRITPGPFPFGGRDEIETFRHKIDDAILRFVDEGDGLKSIDIEITVMEGWLIDQAIDFDGFGGEGTNLLIQVYRGFWGIRYGLPANISPNDDVSFDDLKKIKADGDNDPKGKTDAPWAPPEASDDESDFTSSAP